MERPETDFELQFRISGKICRLIIIKSPKERLCAGTGLFKFLVSSNSSQKDITHMQERIVGDLAPF